MGKGLENRPQGIRMPDRFSDKIETFQLRETTLAPQAVVMSRWVSGPDSVITGDCDARPSASARAEMSGAMGRAEIVVDFGRETVGGLTVTGEAVGETTIRIHYGEDVEEVLRNEEFAADWYKMPKDTFSLQAGSCTLRSRGRRAFRYVRLLIPEGAGGFRIGSIAANQVNYPVDERGAFSSSDPLLNRIWRASALTTKLCMQQFYEDGIKRDGLLWIGDYRVQYLSNALCFGDAALARKCLYMFASIQNEDGSVPACAVRAGGHQHPFNIEYMPTLPDALAWSVVVNYCADYVGGVREYYWFTGDLETLTGLWPTVMRAIAYLRDVRLNDTVLDNNSITDVPSYSGGFWPSRGTVALQLCGAARDASALASILNDDPAGRECESFFAEQKQLCLDRYYSPERRLFLDDDPDGRTSWHVNAFGVVSGVVDDADGARELLERVAGESDVRRPIAGFMKFWVTLSQFRAGRPEEAVNDIREYYGYMLDHGATTFWDLCDPTEPAGIDHSLPHALSQCHGWNGGPCYLLPAHVLGVQPAEPGFARVVVRPALADLAWAEGVIPTPHGDIFVHWDSTPSVTGHVTLPPGVTGEAIASRDGKDVVVPLQEGANEIA